MITIDTTLSIICLSTGLLGIIAALVGTWLFLQRKSLFGDTMAHATLPGITTFFLINPLQTQSWLLTGGIISALTGAYLVQILQKKTLLKKDTILGIILATSFGLGTLLLSKIQNMHHASQAGITKYLLGNPATILHSDLQLIVFALFLVLAVIYIFGRSYKIMIFDINFAHCVQIHTTKINGIMLTITALTIVLGLQTVGIILISALLINPAAAAYQWTYTFNKLIFLATLISVCCCVFGTLLSANMPHLPTGPIIVVLLTFITIISVLFSPRGIIITWYRRYQQKKQLDYLTSLSYFLLFNESKTDPLYPHNIAALNAIGKNIPKDHLEYLQKHGFIHSPQQDFWQLTPKGIDCLHQGSLL